MRFDDRVARVTGAGNGIGRATALRLAWEGARVAALDINRERSEQVAAEIAAAGGTALALAADVTKIADVQNSVATVVTRFGRIDILVNCAGAGWHQQPGDRGWMVGNA